MSSSRPTRRTFLGAGGAALLGITPLGRAAPRSRTVMGSEEEIRIAVVGIRSRGRSHIEGFRNLPNVRVVALCDVDAGILAREAAKFEERGEKIQCVADFRELLNRSDIDAVSLATPNHWHALQTVWACESGLDVYVEKPVSHSFLEGELMVRAASQNNRIVQTGTQSRSSQAIQEAIDWMHAGNLGSIKIARGFCYKPRQSIGKVNAAQEIPEGINYNLWTGPAPLVPLRRRNLHYDWHWDSATGNGDLGNQGVHQVDLCRWALGEKGLPSEVLSIGGRMGYDDDGNTPNTQLLWCRYPTAPILFEVRGLPKNLKAQKEDWGGRMDRYEGIGIGVIVECERGKLHLPNYSSAEAFDSDGNSIRKWNGARNHFENFVAAVRSGNSNDLSAEIKEGHLSAAPCHFGAISHSLGQQATAAEIQRSIAGVSFLEDAFARLTQHLQSNEIDISSSLLTLGRKLTAGGENDLAETLGADLARPNLLFRPGRQPFRFPGT